MDQRTEPIEQDIAAIRESMTEKMGQIENRIRGSVEETSESLKRTVDLHYQVEQHPWAMFGTAVLLGYAVGSLGGNDSHSSHSSADHARSYTGQPAEWEPAVTNGTSHSDHSGHSFLNELRTEFSDELELVKTVAVSSAIAFLRDVIRESLPGVAGELEKARRAQGGVVSSAPAAPAPPPVPGSGLRRSTSTGEQPIINNEFIPTNSTNY